jgi:hypothetical protein
MSRYEYLPPDWSSDYSFAVVLDPALETFFTQVMDYSISRDDDCVIVWLTPRPREILDPDELVRIVNRRIGGMLPAVRLTKKMRERLMGDMEREDEKRWVQG